ncbi:hypothetical protein NEOLEDRAFT_1111584 [Neolentinus lepideus HHB14362 ss-1]|uniref:C2 domain-containing protein n=1 Tax=Neolentinus lepideus HHB14362 ss-1 TaxID=1314782 RepID=A0A165TP95_9AGAM|nr:hypothetical protein NEOLEDRAFT_1111584 [Neolentinus lepideus HHB14362 ss-1]
MSYTPHEIGTLIVVILKARNLPNKRHIGKQDPYCTVFYNNEKRKTKAIKRGGQHPEWDEEVRFTLFEDMDDELARTVNGDESPPPPPPKDGDAPKGVKGGKVLRLACYADDPREPDLIGETTVDLTEVLTKGETDEWFTLMHKDRYSGEVYLELTFWSNAPPPKKKSVSKPVVNRNHYGGAGSFVPADEIPSSSSSQNATITQRSVSSWTSVEAVRRDSVPGSLRPSGSHAQLDLYVAPYERASHMNDIESSSAVDQVTNDFAEFGVSGHRGRTESYPPIRNGYPPRSASAGGISNYESFSHHSHNDNSSTYSDGSSYYAQPSTLAGHLGDNQSAFSTSSHTSTPSTFQVPYHATTRSGYSPYRAPTRIGGHRYSIPSSSSGFMPLPTPSGFMPLSSHPSEPSGFGAPQSAPTPVPSGFMPVRSPAPSGFISSAPSYQGQPSYAYSPYHPSPSSAIPPQDYAPPLPPASAPPQQHPLPQPPMSAPPLPHSSHSAPPQPYSLHTLQAPSPSNEQLILPQSTSSSISTGGGSRPLPQQPQPYPPPQAPPRRQSSLPVPPPPPLPGQPPNAVAFPPSQSSGHIPPPPPLPSQEPSPHSYPLNIPPPPPLPASQLISSPSTSSGRPPLPQPPINYGGLTPQPMYQPIPPPPPPPTIPGTQQLTLPSHSPTITQAPYPGPPPRPPQMNGVNGHSQWSPPGPPQSNYPPQWAGVAQQ